MTRDDDELAAFQEALLAVLAEAREHEPGVARSELAVRTPKAFGSYVSNVDLRMLALGIHLNAKWARRC
jgi:hypothetical protein